MTNKVLKSSKNLNVRFCEVDSLGIVWHGNYVKYFEDAREQFGIDYNFDYLDIYENGFIAPIIKLDIDYKSPLKYKDKFKIEIEFINTEAAKIIFGYKIINNDKITVIGKTIQVFLDKHNQLMLTNPDFYKMEKKYGSNLMQPIYIIANNIITSLGFSTQENLKNLKSNICGIKLDNTADYLNKKIYLSKINKNRLPKIKKISKLENLIIHSISKSIENLKINLSDKNIGIIISTTKGNIDDFNSKTKNYLWNIGYRIQNYFNFFNKPIIISHACISGILALITAERLIRNNKYDIIIVTGVDILSKFVVAGFNSFNVLAPQPCKPFDKNRNGISLGEGCGTIILSNNNLSKQSNIEILRGSVSNDANHISGPSRDGSGLALTIKKAMQYSGISKNDINYISAHGTGSNYNDEMESKAISFNGLEKIPTNSLKGYFGHTLGASGIIESIVAFESLKNNFVYKSLGFEKIGVNKNINIIDENQKKYLTTVLKTSAGFGGCNASIIFRKRN